MSESLWLPNYRDSAPTEWSPVGVFIPPGLLFPDLAPTVEELRNQLRSISRTDGLIFCAKLNLIVSNAMNGDELQKQRLATDLIFSTAQLDRVLEFIEARSAARRTAVFFRAQLLDLIQWIAAFSHDMPHDGRTFEDPEARQAFGKAALIVSDLWGKRVYENKVRMGPSLEESRLRALGAARIGIEGAATGVDPLFAVGRGKLIFHEHFKHFRESAAGEFNRASGMSLKSFYAITTIIAVYFLLRSTDAPASGLGLFRGSDFTDLAPALGAAFGAYAAFASQSPDDLAKSLASAMNGPGVTCDWRGLSRIRTRPILRTPDGRCIVMDPVFLTEVACAGPLFAILRKLSKKGDQDKCFVDFGSAFESYSCSILRRMYPVAGPSLFDRLACGVLGTNQAGKEVEIADACLNDVTQLVLFEMKAAWLSDELAAAEDPLKYVAALKERYARPEGPGELPKGAGQLAKNIAGLANGSLQPNSQDFSHAETVYPVLLAYDSRLEAPVHSWFLAREFEAALAPDGANSGGFMRKGRFRVASLIVLSIDVLETLETSVEGFCLTDLLRDYSVACADRMCDMHSFLAISDYRKKLLASRSLAEATLSAIKDAEGLMGIPPERQG